MRSFWFYLYNIFVIPILYIGFYVIALFHKKIRQGIQGRRVLFDTLEKQLSMLKKHGPRFWIHNSSMGEFEQAKPLIETLKKVFPDGYIIVSFYSPSGFENVRDYPHADLMCYMPFDSWKNAKRFIDAIQPDIAIMIRHDLWPNHLWQLHMQQIPTVLVNCSVRSQFWYKIPFMCSACRSFYQCFDLVLAVSQETKRRWHAYRLGTQAVQVIGDTRYDQVVRRAKEAEKIVFPLMKFRTNRKCLVFGSTWPTDEEVIFKAMRQLRESIRNIWYVIVPHEPIEEHIHMIKEQLSQMDMQLTLFSEIEKQSVFNTDVLVVDRIGILASLYALGDLCFVGGGFGPGVHNVLEPAALGKVVVFGPKHKNSFEAGQLKKRGVGFEVSNGDELAVLISSLLKDSHKLDDFGKKATALVQENVGATERIVKYVKTLIPS